MHAVNLGFFNSSRLAVKVCGITNADDAYIAVEAGVDAIGVNLFKSSKRYVALAEASAWVCDVPVTRIAVVVNPDESLLREIVACGVFDAVQFHGDESPEDCAKCELPWIRAIRVRSSDSLTAGLAYQTPCLLLDAFSSQEYGGTGSRVNWSIAKKFVDDQVDRKVVLAGGLTVENVAAGVKVVSPFAVDVASGVERSGNPRQKDARLVREFVRLARVASGVESRQ